MTGPVLLRLGPRVQGHLRLVSPFSDSFFFKMIPQVFTWNLELKEHLLKKIMSIFPLCNLNKHGLRPLTVYDSMSARVVVKTTTPNYLRLGREIGYPAEIQPGHGFFSWHRRKFLWISLRHFSFFFGTSSTILMKMGFDNPRGSSLWIHISTRYLQIIHRLSILSIY